MLGILSRPTWGSWKKENKWGPGFSLRILWCSQSGDNPENNLAKFGYIVDVKVEKEQNPSIFLATFWKLS
jgi:hypothetical protein